MGLLDRANQCNMIDTKYLDFRKILDKISHSIFVDKVDRGGLDNRIVE